MVARDLKARLMFPDSLCCTQDAFYLVALDIVFYEVRDEPRVPYDLIYSQGFSGDTFAFLSCAAPSCRRQYM